MTAAFWLATGQTVTFLAAVAWAFWVTGRIADLITAAEIIKEHSETAALNANRAADRGMTTLLDARQMLDVLAEHWQRMRDQQPETQPMERIGTDTVETERVIDDEWLAAARKRWDEIAAEPVEKPKPSPRTRTRKATT